MRRRLPLLIVALVVAAAALTVGLVVARADTTPTLPQTTAADLLFNMATTDHHDLVVSGSVSWTNDLFGNSSIVSTEGGGAQLPMVTSGSGRVWFQGGNLRLESQGQGGDQVVVFNKAQRVLWLWNGGKDTVTKVVLPAGAGHTSSPMPSPTFGAAQIAKVLQEMLPTAKVEVTGTTSIDGHDAYLLTLTPSTSDTALGSVQVAVDGHTYLPLRVQVFATGHDKPTLSFGFTSVSYSPVSSDLFAFTPPTGAKVTTHEVQAPQTQPAGAEPQTAPTTEPKPEPSRSPLTLMQAEAKAKAAGFTLATPQGYTARPFDGAWSIDKAQVEKHLARLQRQMAASGRTQAEPPTGASPAPAQSGQQAFDPSKLPDTVVLMKYGQGFGTIWLAQAPDNSEVDKAIAQLPSIFGQQTIAGSPAQVVTTPLGGIAVWKHNGATLIAGGMVSQADLADFVASIQ